MNKKSERPLSRSAERGAVTRMLNQIAELKPAHRRVVYMFVRRVHSAQTGGTR